MTTIVITEEEIAFDSQTTINNERAVSPSPKVRLVRPGIIFMFAGDCEEEPVIENWLRQHGHDPKFWPRMRKGASFQALIYTRKGLFELTEHSNGYGVQMSAPRCLGTGAEYAMGLLAANKLFGQKYTALQCVQAAGYCDVNTGPPYHTLNIKQTLAKRKV